MSVHRELYKQYFGKKNEPLIDETVTSSHWKDYAEKINVTSTNTEGREEYILNGFGFGENEKKGRISNAFAALSIFLYNRILNMRGLSEDVKNAKIIVKRMGLFFSLDAFRQVCTLNFLKNTMPSSWLPERIIIIGDGYGVLSGLLHSQYPLCKIYLIDLGPMLFFQSYYLQQAYPDVNQCIVGSDSFVESTFNFCSAETIEKINTENVDLAVNIASMQEMSGEMVTQYFLLLRKLYTKNFYCCNRIEKKMPGGEISCIKEYPWSANDIFLVDEICPWHTWFLGRGKTPNVKLKGLSIPFMHEYDGAHWHRFATLSNR